MATEAQTAANRQNAQASSGPRTEAGKAASSRNALTLGLYTGTDYVLPEEQNLHQKFCETLFTELDPQGLLEETLASEIIGASWRLRRCSEVEAALAGFDESTDKTRRSVERARAHAHSILHRCINQFRRLQTERACRVVMNAVGDDGGIADYQHVVVAANNYEKGKHLHAKSRQMNLATELASICNEGHSAKAESVQTARNAQCPCNSGEKYKRCCGKNAPPLLGKAA